MKTFFRLASLLALLILVAVATAFGADVAAPAATQAAPQAVSILAWFQQNIAAILGALLAVSEMLSLTPWFKGNGVLDSAVKSLKYLASKEQGN